MRLAAESLPEGERCNTLQEYIQTYAEALCEHLRVKRTPAALEQYEFIQVCLLFRGHYTSVFLFCRSLETLSFAFEAALNVCFGI